MTASVTRLPEVGFSIRLELGKHHGGNFLRAVLAVGDRDVDAGFVLRSFHDLEGDHLALGFHFIEAAPHEALDGIDGVLTVDDCLALGGLSHHAFAVLVECHHGRAQAPTLCGRDDGRLTAFHDGDHAVRGAQVDSNNLSHVDSP